MKNTKLLITKLHTYFCTTKQWRVKITWK